MGKLPVLKPREVITILETLGLLRIADEEPAVAAGAGLLALHWLVQGYGYEITSADVLAAYDSTMKAAEKLGTGAETREHVRNMVAANAPGVDAIKRILYSGYEARS